MVTGRTSRIWGPELVIPDHGPAYSPQLTSADYRRMWLALRMFQRFKMPNQTEQGLLDKLRSEHITRAATVSNGAYLTVPSNREWT